MHLISFIHSLLHPCTPPSVQAHSDGHELVTTGIYKHLRHPAYFGWFWWSVSTQVLLGNPLCTCAYAYASWKFFESRIYHEERYLCVVVSLQFCVCVLCVCVFFFPLCLLFFFLF